MTDMGIDGGKKTDGPRWSDCPLEPRVRQLESDMAVAQNDIGGLKKDVEPLPDLASAVSGLKVHVRVSWVLLSAVVVAVIGSAIAIIMKVP